MIERILDVDQEIAEVKKKAEEHCEKWEKRRELVALAKELTEGFDHPTRKLSISGALGTGTHGSIAIDFHLQGKQSIEDVKPLLKAAAATRLFYPADKHDYVDMSWVAWNFQLRDRSDTLMIRVWLGTSTVCKKVPTGKMVPEYEIVCEPVSEEENIGEEG